MESAPIFLSTLGLVHRDEGLVIPHIISSIVHRHADWSDSEKIVDKRIPL
jgi:hypothetical protein